LIYIAFCGIYFGDKDLGIHGLDQKKSGNVKNNQSIKKMVIKCINMFYQQQEIFSLHLNKSEV